MDRGKVAEECETHSRHAICSPDTAFLFLLVLTDLFKMEWQKASLWKYSYIARTHMQGILFLLHHTESCRFVLDSEQ